MVSFPVPPPFSLLSLLRVEDNLLVALLPGGVEPQ
jgi:hypothetical protein